MDKVFKNNPTLESYSKTSDGTAFYNPYDAKMHAKSLKDKSILTVFKSDLKTNEKQELKDKSIKPLKAEELIASIKESTTAEQLEAFQGDERKSVKEALAVKKAELESLDQEENTNEKKE